MSYEPRVRGSRFRRPSTKKRASKERRREPNNQFLPDERPQINPSELASKTVNALIHLGQQRFPLPPYSEHFERWTRDLQATLNEFESLLPQTDNTFHESSVGIVSQLHQELTIRSSAEAALEAERSSLETKLNLADVELSKLDHEYKAQVAQAKQHYEQSFSKLRKEIENLDRERLKILRNKPSLVSRLLRRHSNKLEDSTNRLQAKRAVLGDTEKSLTDKLTVLRADYLARKDKLLAEQNNAVVAASRFGTDTLNDALDIRKKACGELTGLVTEATNRISVDETPREDSTPS